MDKYEVINLILRSLSLMFVVIGFYLTIQSLRRNHDWNRRKASADALRIVGDGTQIDNLELLNRAFNYTESNEPITLETINAKIAEDSKILHTLLMRLNLFEMYAIGVRQGIYDMDVIKATIGPPMIKAYRRFKPFIDYYNKNLADGFCDDLEQLVLKWEVEQKAYKPRSKTA